MMLRKKELSVSTAPTTCDDDVEEEEDKATAVAAAISLVAAAAAVATWTAMKGMVVWPIASLTEGKKVR